VKAGGKQGINRLHGIISQKIVLFITTIVRTSNPTSFIWSTYISKFLQCGKTGRHTTRNEILREDIGTQNLLIWLKGQRLQWFGQIKTMDRTRISRRALQLEFKGKTPMG
jgi:hypothetical protein